MDIIPILGLLGTAVDLTRAVPQLVRLLQIKKAHGVSVDSVGTSFVVSTGWTIYGLITNQPYVALASGVIALTFLTISLVALRFGRSWREFKVAPIWLVTLTIFGLFGKNGLSIILSIGVLISNIPQIRVAYKEEDLSGLSLGTWLLSLTGGLIWGWYAIIQHDQTIIFSATFQTITSITIILLKILKPIAKNIYDPEISIDQ